MTGGTARRTAVFALAAACLLAGIAGARSATRPSLAAARAAFDALPVRNRNEIFLELIATGDFNAMASNELGGRLYDATASFQAKHGLAPSGVLTPATQAALSDVGGRIFNSWGFEFLDHPLGPASVAVPSRFEFLRTPTRRGFALDTRNRSMSIDFAFFADGDATLDTVFNNLTAPIPGRRIDMKMIRPTFFAIAGGSDKTTTYTRYILVPGGMAGFTITWNTDAYPNGARIAIVMANELYPRHMVSDDGQQADIFENLPGDAGPSPSGAPHGYGGPTLSDDKTPTNVGSDVVSQAVLQAKLEAQRKAEQDAADRRAAADAAARAAAQERIRIAQQEEIDRQAKAEADRLVRRAAAERKAKAEQDARDAAAAQLKAERLARALAAARETIADASGFVKSNRDDPQLMDHFGHIAELNAALSSTDPQTVESKIAGLRTALAADPAYAAYEAARAAEHQREAARYLGDAVRTLKTQRTFLVGALAQDPTSPQADRFLSFVKQIDGTLASPDLDRAQTLMGTIDRTVGEAGLHDAYAAVAATAAKTAAAEAVAARTAAAHPADAEGPRAVAAATVSEADAHPVGDVARLPVTDKNRFLLEGGGDDVVVMVSASSKAPHAYRDLNGDLVFDRDRADVCLFGQGDDRALASIVRSALSSFRLKQLAVGPAPCDGDRLDRYDVVATRRGAFLRKAPPVALQLVGAVETDLLKPLATITPAALQAATAAEAAAGEAVAQDVARGTRPGFGVILIGDGVASLCAAVPDDADAHQRLLNDRRDVLAAAMGVTPVVALTTADGAFFGAKRGECGAVYASAADLKTLSEGLRRDGTTFRFSSVWIAPAALQAADDAITAEHAAADKQAADRQRQQMEDAKISAMRGIDDAATLSAREDASQGRYTRPQR